MEIKRLSTQLAIFLSENITRPDKLFNSLNEDLGEIIDTMPQIFPLPPGIPVDMPVVMGNASNGIYTLNISASRVDIIRTYLPEEDKAKSLLEFKSKCKLLMSLLLVNYKIARIGIVGNFYIESKNPSSFITKNFFRKEDSTLQEASVRLNKVSDEFGMKFNNILSLNVAEMESATYSGKCVLIQTDNNSIPGENPLTPSTINDVFDKKSNAYSEEYIKQRVG